jgi:dihydrodipicolinate synthase/N-acetylneuraminate lyase
LVTFKKKNFYAIEMIHYLLNAAMDKYQSYPWVPVAKTAMNTLGDFTPAAVAPPESDNS